MLGRAPTATTRSTTASTIARGGRRRCGPGVRPRPGRARPARSPAAPTPPRRRRRRSRRSSPRRTPVDGSFGARVGRRCRASDRARASPSTATASASPGGALLGRSAGACLACRVSSVACWARSSASTGVGGRPCSAWNAAARSAWRASIAARRVDHTRISSRVDADDLPHRPLPGRSVGRSVNRDAEPRGAALRGGCCTARTRRRRLVQHPPVQGQPRPVRAAGPCSRPRHGCAGPGRRPGSPGA